MDKCGHLFRVEKLYAYYVASDKHVVVAADLWMDPFHDSVQICPNPLALPTTAAPEFILEGTTRVGGPLGRILLNRIYYSYPSDPTPKNVIVYTMGVDAPVHNEVQLGAAPARLQPAAAPTTTPTPTAPTPAPARGPVEVTGFSPSYSLEEAILDALTKALPFFPSPPRNPDVGVAVTVKEITAVTGGYIRPGLTIKATAR